MALLVALLLPALKGARASARAIQCLSNLRQLGMGFHLYAGDNDQRLPYAYVKVGSTTTSTWVVELLAFVDRGPKWGADNIYGGAYTCPVIQSLEPDLSSGGYRASYGVVYSSYYGLRRSDPNNMPIKPNVSFTDLADPSKSMVLADIKANGTSVGASYINPSVDQSASWVLRAIHMDQVSALYLDAHAGRVRYDQAPGPSELQW